MYHHYFGLKERPFKLVPNPAYLYLSKSHEEALGHLNYAVQHGDGFVEITGEAGTGKTTVCRMFLENLDERTEAAYIFNPKLDSLQLLKAVTTELGMGADADNIKELIDVLNAYLMECKTQGKNVLLVIDEAQNLDKDVLEQLRLLSNLEMNAAKLIQIILVGQPELTETLDSYELRQLSQRITLRCRLLPLTRKETGEYIRHRLNIAAHGPRVKFTGPAIRAIYRYSRGIPRLISIVCDRALLTAYTMEKRVVSRGIVRSAIEEIKGRGQRPPVAGWKPVLLFGALCLVLVSLVLSQPGFFPAMPAWIHPRQGASAPVSSPNTSGVPLRDGDANGFKQATVRSRPADKGLGLPASHQTPPEPGERLDSQPALNHGIGRAAVFAGFGAAETIPAPEISLPELQAILRRLSARASRRSAIAGVIGRWSRTAEITHYLDSVEDDREFFTLAAKQNGLTTVRMKTDLAALYRINLPVVLELRPEGEMTPRYLGVTRGYGNRLVIMLDTGPVAVAAADLAGFWTGVAVIPWKNFYNYAGLIPINAPQDTIRTFKMHLKEIGHAEDDLEPVYTDTTRQLVTKIQKEQGLTEDGVAGPLTYIALYNATPSLPMPHLWEETGGSRRFEDMNPDRGMEPPERR
ncbi:MAG: AAA family ATPase [Thermodesulfobacteriota bacterium]